MTMWTTLVSNSGKNGGIPSIALCELDELLFNLRVSANILAEIRYDLQVEAQALGVEKDMRSFGTRQARGGWVRIAPGCARR
jgi:hypothetical protein